MGKKAWPWVAIAACAVGLLAVVIWVSGRDENDAVKIGAILPLTGSAAPYGQNAKRGIELSLSEINSQGGLNGKPLQVLYEDSKTEPKEAVAALRKLHHAQGVRFIIGDINSTGVLAMAPIAEREHIILLSPGASNPKISDAGEYVFRNWHSDALEGKVGAEYAYSKMGWKRAAVLYVNAAYGAGLAETFRSEFHKLGGKIVAYEAYPQDATDMREQISRILAAKPKGIYLPGWPKEMSVALRQLDELGWEGPVMSAQGFDDPSILELAGSAAEGVVFSVPQEPEPGNKLVKHFNQEYGERYDKEPGVCSASGYDALRIFAHAIKSTGPDVEAVRQVLSNLRDFPGAAGPISFDEHGDLLKPFSFKRVTNGRFAKFK